jgi:tyrosyl-tRNA synthetase
MGEGGKVVGKKMSKSADNYIGLQEAPLAMYRKVMQVDDDVIFRYFDLLSGRSNEAIAEMRASRKDGADPRGFKSLFALELIERFHDAAAARTAKAEFETIYSADALPTDIAEHTLTTESETLWIAKALSTIGLVKSTGEGKRLVEQGGVELDQVRVTDANHQLQRGKRYLLRVGSKNRRFAYVTVAS